MDRIRSNPMPIKYDVYIANTANTARTSSINVMPKPLIICN